MRLVPVWVSLVLLGCGSKEQEFQDISGRRVTLPDGTAIHAELKTDRQGQAVGMMFRDSLAADHGMLFVYGGRPIREPYWMHNVRIPLDIVWLDKTGKVVEVVSSAPPCLGEERSCPHYGGSQPASFVLELGGGQAKAHGVQVGTVVHIS